MTNLVADESTKSNLTHENPGGDEYESHLSPS